MEILTGFQLSAVQKEQVQVWGGGYVVFQAELTLHCQSQAKKIFGIQWLILGSTNLVAYQLNLNCGMSERLELFVCFFFPNSPLFFLF